MVLLSRELELNGYLPLNKFVKYLKEAAPSAYISYPTAIKLVNEGKIRAQRVGSQVRVSRIEIERWKAEGNFVEGLTAEIPKKGPGLI